MDKFEKAARRHEGIYVTVTYDIDRFCHGDIEYDEIICKVSKKYGGDEFGSGGGFGGRDISFGFEKEKKGESFMKAVKKECIKYKLKLKFSTERLDDYYDVGGEMLYKITKAAKKIQKIEAKKKNRTR